MTAVTESYTIGLQGIVDTCLKDANVATEQALIVTEQGVTLATSLHPHLSRDMDLATGDAYPIAYVYEGGGDVSVDERLNRVQDWVVPFTVSVLYQAMDPNLAAIYAVWYGQLTKQCVEKNYRGMTHLVGITPVAIPVWLLTVDKCATEPQRIDESRFLYRTDVACTMYYRTRRNG